MPMGFDQGEPLKLAGVVDLVVALDVTGSMQPCIDKLKANIRRFVEELQRSREAADGQVQVRVADWRMRLLPFRDLERQMSLPAIIDDLPFVTSVEAIAAQLADPSLTAAGGGGDGPESILDALYRAAKRSEWRGRGVLRFVVVFSDNRPHERLHPSSILQGGPDDVDEVREALRAAGVRTIVYAVRHPALESIVALRPSIATTSRLFESPRAAHEFFGSQDARFEGLLENLAATISTSVSEVA